MRADSHLVTDFFTPARDLVELSTIYVLLSDLHDGHASLESEFEMMKVPIFFLAVE